jgi:hypothetical protein
MKWHLLLMPFVLTSCSPVAPSAMDMQFALESYYRDYVYPRDDSYDVIVRCNLISEYTASSDGGEAIVRFHLGGLPGGLYGNPKGITEIKVVRRNYHWLIPQDVKLQNLPCKAFKATPVRQATE